MVGSGGHNWALGLGWCVSLCSPGWPGWCVSVAQAGLNFQSFWLSVLSDGITGVSRCAQFVTKGFQTLPRGEPGLLKVTWILFQLYKKTFKGLGI